LLLSIKLSEKETMPESIEILDDLNIILVTSYGIVTAEDLQNSRHEVVRIYQAHGITQVLVDTSAITSLPSLVHLFHHSSKLKQPEIPTTMKFAIVVSEHIYRDARFIEMVAQNRSTSLRNFDERDQALSWLKEGPV